MRWYKFAITNDDVVANKHSVIEEDFNKIAIPSNAPDGFALFDKPLYGGGFDIYLVAPTGEEQYARSFKALYPFQPADPLVDDELVTLIAGKYSAWRLVR
jgi:hypothetical protein